MDNSLPEFGYARRRRNCDVALIEETPDSSIISQSMDDPEVFGVLFDRHGPTIAGYLGRRVGEVGEALTADVFVIAFEKRHEFVDSRNGSARPWLYGISSNLLRRHFRQEQRHFRAFRKLHAESSMAEDFESVDARLDASAALVATMTAIKTLRDEERDVLLLTVWEGLSEVDVAVALDIRVGTVKSRLSRSRKKIRERVAACGHQVSTTTNPFLAKEGSK